ncbi:hypothetical protein B0O80DRAFT_436404 [Mortierella sp. GBAus27b]|nr:hypothetical protein B0O80DRAFT_436404 [Mortierella sp. GBAus27b]
MVYDGLTRSVDATTAFFYRTFSPTYRVTRLYIDSWSNGSQRRGLGRIRNSVFRGDAFKLIKGSAVHMKKTWNQVLTAYRTKSVTTTTTTTTTTTSTTPATRTSLSTPTENATHIHNKKESSKDRSDKNENSSSSNGNDRGNDRGNDKSSSGTRP